MTAWKGLCIPGVCYGNEDLGHIGPIKRSGCQENHWIRKHIDQAARRDLMAARLWEFEPPPAHRRRSLKEEQNGRLSRPFCYLLSGMSCLPASRGAFHFLLVLGARFLRYTPVVSAASANTMVQTSRATPPSSPLVFPPVLGMPPTTSVTVGDGAPLTGSTWVTGVLVGTGGVGVAASTIGVGVAGIAVDVPVGVLVDVLAGGGGGGGGGLVGVVVAVAPGGLVGFGNFVEVADGVLVGVPVVTTTVVLVAVFVGAVVAVPLGTPVGVFVGTSVPVGVAVGVLEGMGLSVGVLLAVAVGVLVIWRPQVAEAKPVYPPGQVATTSIWYTLTFVYSACVPTKSSV